MDWEGCERLVSLVQHNGSVPAATLSLLLASLSGQPSGALVSLSVLETAALNTRSHPAVQRQIAETFVPRLAALTASATPASLQYAAGTSLSNFELLYREEELGRAVAALHLPLPEPSARAGQLRLALQWGTAEGFLRGTDFSSVPENRPQPAAERPRAPTLPSPEAQAARPKRDAISQTAADVERLKAGLTELLEARTREGSRAAPEQLAWMSKLALRCINWCLHIRHALQNEVPVGDVGTLLSLNDTLRATLAAWEAEQEAQAALPPSPQPLSRASPQPTGIPASAAPLSAPPAADELSVGGLGRRNSWVGEGSSAAALQTAAAEAKGGGGGGGGAEPVSSAAAPTRQGSLGLSKKSSSDGGAVAIAADSRSQPAPAGSADVGRQTSGNPFSSASSPGLEAVSGLQEKLLASQRSEFSLAQEVEALRRKVRGLEAREQGGGLFRGEDRSTSSSVLASLPPARQSSGGFSAVPTPLREDYAGHRAYLHSPALRVRFSPEQLASLAALHPSSFVEQRRAPVPAPAPGLAVSPALPHTGSSSSPPADVAALSAEGLPADEEEELDFDALHFGGGSHAPSALASPRTPRCGQQSEASREAQAALEAERQVLEAERREQESSPPLLTPSHSAADVMEAEALAGRASPAGRVGPQDFELLKTLGQGAFGKVFQVRKRDTGRIFAMKVMRKQRVMEKEHSEYVRVERDVLTAVQHPYIVTLRYSFQTESKLYLVMDFINGGHLFFQLYRQFTFSEELARLYAAELVLALGHLHSLGYVHRDLKPENLLLDSEGHLKVTDFGLAKSGLCGEQRTNSFIGTMEYMAPEVISGSGHGKEVDWWSVGILLYEMLSGFPPFRAKSRTSLQKQILTSKFKLEKYWSSAAASLLKGLLQRDPAKRLGAGAEGTTTVQRHPFFRGINWEKLEARETPSPFRPNVQHSMSVENFDKIWTELPAVDSPCGTPNGKTPPPVFPKFEGFSYVAPSLLEDRGFSDFLELKKKALAANT